MADILEIEDERLKQKAKNKKIAEVQKAGAVALISALLEGVEDSSVEILSNKKNETVALVKAGKNVGVFKFGEVSSKWLPKIQKVIEAFSDFSKSGEEIFDVIKKQRLPLAEIPKTEAEKITFKADSDGSLNLFAKGVLTEHNWSGVKNLALFGITELDAEQSGIIYGVFSNCKSLVSVALPEGMEKIGERAFSYCESLSSVVIPSSVTEICESAFYDCTSLSSVVIPSSVTEICESAFYDCTSLSSVVIPSSVTVIGEYAFCGCKSLTSVEIPEGVTEIGEKAFEGCNISELSHPCLTIKGGFAIKDNVLLYCTSPSDSITIPEEVTEICESAFYGCTSLASVEIPPSITEIGERAFEGCTSLSSVAIGEGVTKIDWCAFRDCSSLSSVVIPPSVTKIDWCAFYGCSSLSSVSIPPSVAEIGKYAFFHCDSLSSVEFGGTMAQWDAVKKGKAWNGNASAKTVKCADGEAALA